MIDQNFKELEGKYFCNICKKKSHGRIIKKILNAPRILIFTIYNLQKSSMNSNLPYEIKVENNMIDLSKYMESRKLKNNFCLYGTISHYGNKNFGHYIR
jgi:ubiquitin C-terminal hydrolase